MWNQVSITFYRLSLQAVSRRHLWKVECHVCSDCARVFLLIELEDTHRLVGVQTDNECPVSVTDSVTDSVSVTHCDWQPATYHISPTAAYQRGVQCSSSKSASAKCEFQLINLCRYECTFLLLKCNIIFYSAYNTNQTVFSQNSYSLEDRPRLHSCREVRQQCCPMRIYRIKPDLWNVNGSGTVILDPHLCNVNGSGTVILDPRLASDNIKS